MRNATLGFVTIAVDEFTEDVLCTLFAVDLTVVHIVESLTVRGGLLTRHVALRQ